MGSRLFLTSKPRYNDLKSHLSYLRPDDVLCRLFLPSISMWLSKDLLRNSQSLSRHCPMILQHHSKHAQSLTAVLTVIYFRLASLHSWPPASIPLPMLPLHSFVYYRLFCISTKSWTMFLISPTATARSQPVTRSYTALSGYPQDSHKISTTITPHL